MSKNTLDLILAEPTRYDMIGGEPVVIATVTEMYARIMKDPLLFPFFEHSDVMNQIRMQKKFLTTVLKERDLPQFAKVSMKYAHSKLGLNNTHFDRIKCIIGDCLLNQGVTTELVAATLSFTEKFRNYIVISDEPRRKKSTLRDFPCILEKKDVIRTETTIDRILAEPTLYDMVGGQQTVSKIVALMYEAIPLDDILKDFFTNADMIRQIRMQTKFLTMVLQEKKPTYYQKVAMSGAHRHLRLRSHHFDRIKTIIESSMRAVGISIDLIEEALLSVEKFRSYIVGAGSMFKMEEEDNDALEGTLTVNSSLEKLD